MTIALYQILVPTVSLLFVLKAFSHFLRGEKTIRELVSWIIFWGTISCIAIFPDITSHVAIILGVKSNVNALLFSIIGIILYIVFKLMIDLENAEQQMTVLTRKLAIRDLKEKNKNT